MLSGKERSKLLSIAAPQEAIFQIGKGGVGDLMISELADALKARELIKITVLPNSGIAAKELIRQLATDLNAEPVRAIGRKIILYKRPDDPSKAKIKL